jgi:hypothetical protein
MEKSITININNLIENFSITGELTDSKESIKKVITETLLSAVNDVNLANYSETKSISSANAKEPTDYNQKLIDLKFQCLRYATEKNGGDILSQAKEYFTWLNTKD